MVPRHLSRERSLRVDCVSSQDSESLALLQRPPIIRHLGAILCMAFVGSSSEIQDTLASMPKLSNVTRLMFLISQSPLDSCLKRLPHVFPNADDICLICHAAPADYAIMNVEFLKPLEDCSALTCLAFGGSGQNVNTAGLVQLCGRLGKLTYVAFQPSEQVDIDQLAAGFLGLGQEIDIKVE